MILDCGEDKPDDNRYYYGLADFDQYRMQELEWLKNEVNTPEYRNARFRVIIVHMPIIPVYKIIYARLPFLIKENRGYGPGFLAEHFGPVLREAGADLMIAAHTHRHLWLSPPFSGYSFPVLINGNTNYVKAVATDQSLSIQVISDQGVSVFNKDLKKK